MTTRRQMTIPDAKWYACLREMQCMQVALHCTPSHLETFDYTCYVLLWPVLSPATVIFKSKNYCNYCFTTGITVGPSCKVSIVMVIAFYSLLYIAADKWKYWFVCKQTIINHLAYTVPIQSIIKVIVKISSVASVLERGFNVLFEAGVWNTTF